MPRAKCLSFSSWLSCGDHLQGKRTILSMDYVDYAFDGYWRQEGDERTKHYPLMSAGPLPLLAIIGAYVLGVQWIGPRLMQHRRPFELKRVMIAYNVYNIVLNGWFFFESLRCLDYGRLLFVFDYPSRSDWSPKARWTCWMLYLFFLSKLVDLFDTVLFVLRKKSNQVTILHVYHHSIVPIIVWMALKLMPTGGPAGLFPLLNSAIHVIMYAYYTLSVLKLDRYLSWKKYLTILQLIQFVLFIVHSTLFLCLQQGHPAFIVYLACIQNPLFLAMFYHFFQNTYGNTRGNKMKL